MSTGMARNSKPPKAPPEKKVGPFSGGVGVSIWLNRVESDQGVRVMRSITINPRRYLDQVSGQWKDAPSYNPSDLPALIFALTKAQEYCYETSLPGMEGEPMSEGEDNSLDDVPY